MVTLSNALIQTNHLQSKEFSSAKKPGQLPSINQSDNYLIHLEVKNSISVPN